MKTPQRLFFLLAFICLFLALLLQFLGQRIGYYFLESRGALPSFNGEDFALAKYYFETGQPDQSISEITKQIASLSPVEVVATQADLDRILYLYQNPKGQLGFLVLQIQSVWLSKLYVAFFILVVFGIATFVYTRFGEHPLFVVMPFANYAGLNIGEDLPAAVLDRVREIAWRSKNLKNVSSMIAENFDIPTLGMETDHGNFDTVAFLETALLFSMGVSNFPLARLVNSVRLWFEQPTYLVRGSFERIHNQLLITTQLIDNFQKTTVQVWSYEVPEEEHLHHSEIVDAVLYPLFFRFSKGLEANSWEALYALHVGIEEFQYFIYHQDRIHHLDLAREKMVKSLELDPGYGLAHYNLGLVFLAAGEYESAREHFLDACRLLGENKGAVQFME